MHERIALWIAECMGACPMGLQYARAHTEWICKDHGRLPSEFATCTGAYPMDLQDARALARRICNMHGHIPNGLAKITGACPAVKIGLLGEQCTRHRALAIVTVRASARHYARHHAPPRSCARVPQTFPACMHAHACTSTSHTSPTSARPR
ncbi:hypothetical protein CRG98_028503 [Punica granatum]|uniref:Uncharacterized protein n=1 Tax=Punica granatum TaxID=22663 RepID=A0A2I0J4D0_PUNGR|nr:hypothetical protein CRG98_028503 [Punica granatum]